MLALITLLASMVYAQEPAPAGPEAPAAPAAPAAPEAPPAPVAPADDAASLWEKRVDPVELKKALDAYEALHTANPADRAALEKLVRGWYFYGDSHTDDVPTKLERWQKSIDFGNKCLALNSDYKARLDGGEKEKDAIVVAKVDDVPCMYWTSTALGKWAKAQSLSLTLKHLPTVKAYMTKTEELDPTYFNYGPARYWGVYYAALPSFAGKDLVKSEEYLKASLEGAPNYLATRVLRAEYLAVANQDAKLFEDDLNYVINADPNKLPECLAENTKEQEKAKKLLAKKAELFVEAAPTEEAAVEPDKKKKKQK